MLQNLEQIRAVNALKHAEELDRSAVSRLPALIIANGLLATLAFCEAQGGGEGRVVMREAMNAAAKHLSRLGLLPSGGEATARDLLKFLSTQDSLTLQRATQEVLAFLSYLKRFAPDRKANKAG